MHYSLNPDTFPTNNREDGSEPAFQFFDCDIDPVPGAFPRVRIDLHPLDCETMNGQTIWIDANWALLLGSAIVREAHVALQRSQDPSSFVLPQAVAAEVIPAAQEA